jgi:hypothetical protein
MNREEIKTMDGFYGRANERICMSGRPAPDAPDTPILRLAAERGWPVFSYADDGAGEVEVVPGIFLAIKNDRSEEEDPDDWTVSVAFRVARPPANVLELTTSLPKALQEVAIHILGATDEEIAEVRRQGLDA